MTTDTKELLARLDKEVSHYVCEDCWYSCPKSGECCDDRADLDSCCCGADEENALRKESATAIRSLESRLEAATRAVDTDYEQLYQEQKRRADNNLRGMRELTTQLKAERNAREEAEQLSTQRYLDMYAWQRRATAAEANLAVQIETTKAVSRALAIAEAKLARVERETIERCADVRPRRALMNKNAGDKGWYECGWNNGVVAMDEAIRALVGADKSAQGKKGSDHE